MFAKTLWTEVLAHGLLYVCLRNHITMDTRRLNNNVLAMPLGDNRYMAFHAQNMDVAEISYEAWQSLNQTGANAEALQELQEWSLYIDPETQDAQNPRHINSLSINVAQVCNLKCDYCAADGDGSYGSKIPQLDLHRIEKQLKWVADKLPAGESLHIHFLGGEPMLYPKAIAFIADYIRSYARKRQLSTNFSITTNGTLINSKSAKILADINCGVTVSLDGPKDINDSLRPAKNKSSSTEMTLAGLRQLKVVRKDLSYIKINSVFGTHNLAVLETYRFLRSLDIEIDAYNFNFANNSKDKDATDQYLQQMQSLAKVAYENGGLTELAKFTQFRNTLARLEAQTRSHSYCGAGKSLLQIDTSHKLYPCNWFMGDESEVVGQDTELDSKKWDHYSPELNQLNNCNSCWARHLCGGGCMAVHKEASGNKHSKDPLFCQRSRGLSAEAIYYYTQNLLKGDLDEKY